MVSSALFVQGYRFAVVGIVSTAVNYGFNLAALNFTGRAELSSAIGYLSGVAVGYPLNKTWSFHSQGGGAAWKYFLVYLATFILNSVLAGQAHRFLDAGNAVFHGIPMSFLYYLPVIVVTTIVNFAGCKLFVFRK